MKFGSQRHFPSFARYKKDLRADNKENGRELLCDLGQISSVVRSCTYARGKLCQAKKWNRRFGNSMVVLNNEYLIKLMNNSYQIF